MADQTEERLAYVRLSANQDLRIKANKTANEDTSSIKCYWYNRPQVRLIRKGIHDYSSEIMDWDSLKSFIKCGLITFVTYSAEKVL